MNELKDNTVNNMEEHLLLLLPVQQLLTPAQIVNKMDIQTSPFITACSPLPSPLHVNNPGMQW